MSVSHFYFYLCNSRQSSCQWSFLFLSLHYFFENGRSGILQLEMAEDCLKNAMDLSGLLLLYSSLGDAEGILKLASLAKENGKNNVAFLCLFMLGKLEECLQLLVDRCVLYLFFSVFIIQRVLKT